MARGRRRSSRSASSTPSLASLASFPSLSSLSFDVAHSEQDAPPSSDRDEASTSSRTSSTDVEDESHSSEDSGHGADDDDHELAVAHRRRPSRDRVSLVTRKPSSPARREPFRLDAASPSGVVDAHATTRQLHFRALFVRVDPPLLRSLRRLELSGLHLKRTDLHTLTANLFLLETLQSLSLADNQLEDSCVKEIRTILSLDGLDHVDLSKNLLGRAVAKMLADRLKHRLSVRSLDVSGNPRFFAFADANDVARALAHGLAANHAIVDFRISLPVPQPHLERERLILPPPPQQHHTTKSSTAQRGPSDGAFAPAEAFTRELAELHATTTTGSCAALHSLGLVHAELSRRTIVNLMKLTPRLVALDLSFSFAGIAAAQVIATALKMKDYAALTQLNLRGNRLKAMGARAICRALHTNARLTDLNLSRNELRHELVPDLAAMLRQNHTLVRLDLTQNDELMSGLVESSPAWRELVAALDAQQALLSLGPLHRYTVATETQRRTLQSILDQHQQRSDERVLMGVRESMAFETTHTGNNKTTTPLSGPVVSVTLSPPRSSQKTLWTHRRAIARPARVSIKWKMQAFGSPATVGAMATKKGRGETTRPPVQRTGLRHIHWCVVIHRQCDLAGTVEYEAATGVLAVAATASVGGFELCSALVYCDEGDLISIVASLPTEDEDQDQDDELDGESALSSTNMAIKLLAKDFVVLPHPLTLRHVTYHYDASDSSLLPQNVQWVAKYVRNPAADPYAYTADLQQAYIVHTMKYRLVWRVRVAPILLPSRATTHMERDGWMDTQLHWFVERSPCWEPNDRVVVMEGSCRELAAVVCNQQELVVRTQPIELVAGELVYLRVATTTHATAIELVEWLVLDETTAWENAPSTATHARG